MRTDDVSRRNFMRTAAGATAAAAAGSGTVAAAQDDDEEDGEEAEEEEEEEQEEGEEEEGGEAGGEPDWPSQVEGANEGTFEDARGQDEVTVAVGAGDDGLAFDPTGIWVDPGTTVTWEWTGAGGAHNVVTVEGEADLESELQDEEGATYEYEFTEDDEGITHYHCEPHDDVGMHGGVAVGDDVPTVEEDDEAAGVVFVPDGAKALGIATFIAMCTTLGLAFFFLSYGGDYESQ